MPITMEEALNFIVVEADRITENKLQESYYCDTLEKIVSDFYTGIPVEKQWDYELILRLSEVIHEDERIRNKICLACIG